MDDVSDDTPTLRAADNDRQAVVEYLSRAKAEGRLDLAEFDDRVQRAWAAQTYADLAVLTADLPSDRELPTWQPPVEVYQQPVHQPEPARSAGLFVRAWVAASMVNFVIWVLVCVTSFELVYPWWIWVAGPWGALVLTARMTRFGQLR
jgi:uncharacterized protein DUF1707